MSKRSLFRGKNKDSGEWITVSLESGWSIDESTIGQCTGLSAVKSYRGMEPIDLLIFDGDICEDSEERFIIRWDEKRLAFMMEFKESEHYSADLIPMEEIEDGVTIIGNIYDGVCDGDQRAK